MFGFQMDAMAEPILHQRFVSKPLEEALEDAPVVLIHGPGQCEKTTLARMVGDAAGYVYINAPGKVCIRLDWGR